MAASLFVTGTPLSSARRDGRGQAVVAHAVAKPVVDGLDASVCGVLVTATAERDWPSGQDGARCEECARIAD